ncbi:MAG: cytochrome c oxidase subunit II [Desulfarculus sp.]|nr:cytochrome c oxidase subunit II [Desulfarculus sp.]
MNQQAVNAVLSVDRAFLFIFGVSAAILVLITLATVYFVIRYSRQRHPVPADFDHNLLAEIIWTVIPTLLVLAMFFYGWQSFSALRGMPEGALEVKVLARQWSWSFEYAGGRRSPELYVPVGRPVRLAITSADVIHGFYVPAFRVKMDAVPGLTTQAWLRADQPGDYDIYCSVYCGLEHAKMLSRVRAVNPEDFERWLTQEPDLMEGAKIAQREGCLGCHSTDGSLLVGPSFKGLFGHQTTVLDQGRPVEVRVDAEFVRQVLADPTRRPTQGFPPVMPAYPHLTPEQTAALVEYLKSLGHEEHQP